MPELSTGGRRLARRVVQDRGPVALSRPGGPERPLAERCYYYTCAPGDPLALETVHDTLAKEGFSPVVMHKAKGTRAKGVDISLTKDMLVQAFLQNYQVAVLIAGDGDFVPLV